MLQRAYAPNAHLWNGLGGKLESGETPLASIQREMQEEASIDLKAASRLFFAGITTWDLVDRCPDSGMYVFLAYLTHWQAEHIHTRQAPEGLISWKPLSWICDPGNKDVVSNIPHFLPPMLCAQKPYEYFYAYEREDDPEHSLRKLIIRPLPPQIVLSDCQES